MNLANDKNDRDNKKEYLDALFRTSIIKSIYIVEKYMKIFYKHLILVKNIRKIENIIKYLKNILLWKINKWQELLAIFYNKNSKIYY